VEILSQYDLAKLGFRTLEEKNTNSDGYLDPDKMPDFFQKLYKEIDTDGKNGVDRTEIAAAFKDQSKRDQLVKLIAKHPSEWHSSTISTIKTTLSNWATETTEDETKALMAHEKERMEKLEWMSQISASPVVFGPMVWHFNPIALISFIHQSSNGHNWARSAFGNLLAKVESNNDYTAYNQLNNSKLKAFYSTNITSYTLDVLMEKQKKNSNGFREIFAAGRYQIIPDTLKDAVAKMSLSCEEKFTSELQDRIFNEYIIKIKRPNIIKYLDGDGDVEDAIHDWAMEFASAGVRKGKEIKSIKMRDSDGNVMLDAKTKKAKHQKRYASFEGESYYNGDGFNTAHIMPDDMVAILKESKKNGG
jgi:hypothetical protein